MTSALGRGLVGSAFSCIGVGVLFWLWYSFFLQNSQTCTIAYPLRHDLIWAEDLSVFSSFHGFGYPTEQVAISSAPEAVFSSDGGLVGFAFSFRFLVADLILHYLDTGGNSGDSQGSR